MSLSFQKLFFAIATIFAMFAIMVLAKSILIPLSFALLFSLILFPVAKKFELWKMGRILAAFVSIFAVIVIVGAVIFFFSAQIISIAKEFSNFKDKILHAFADVTIYLNHNVSFMEHLEKDELFNRMKAWLTDSTGTLVSKTVSNTATFMAGMLATIIFTFLFLIYRDGLTHALLAFSPQESRQRVLRMFKSIQQVGQKYLFGMIILTLVIGLANSIGLWIIGIDNPFFFGFLGATLAIIPYIGTTIGAVIPIIYAFVSYDSMWTPLAVGVLFWAVQLISDNLLTPKIVGGGLSINAFTAILSLFVGAAVWGLAGMILFLPFAAILRVVCEEFEELRPIALIIGEYNKEEDDSRELFLIRWWERIKDRFKK